MRYKYLLVPMGLDPHRNKPHIWSAIASGAASLLSSFVNNEMQKETNQQMIDNQWQMFRAQNERQDYLNENQDLIKRNSLKRAGMNVNAEFGGYPNLNTNAVSQPQLGVSQIDGATLANLMQQAPLIEAQARKLNADAESQEILNEREHSIDKGLRKYVLDNLNTDNIVGLDGTLLDNVDVQGSAKGINAGTFEAQKRIREYKSELLQLDKNDVKNVLDKLVSDKQLKDNNVIKALQKMPYYDYLKLSRECAVLLKEKDVQSNLAKYYEAAAKNQDAQAELSLLEKDIQENTNIAEIIHRYLGDGPLSDAAMLLVTIFGAVTGQMHFGYNRSKSNSTSKSESNVTSNSHSTSNNVSHVHTYKHD